MKILFLGEVGPGQTSLMRMRALQRLGHDVVGVHTIEPWKRASWAKRQMQRRLERGSIVDEINSNALKAGREFRPDMVWAEKQQYLRLETVMELRKLGAKLVHFTPDPYFSVALMRTEIMNRTLEGFHAFVYCKSYERKEYEALAKPLVYMPLGYCDETHNPLPSDDPRWSCAVGFLGTWDPLRETLLHEVVASGLNTKIWGAYWDFLRDGRWTLRRHIILRGIAGRQAFRIHRDEVLAAACQGGEVYAEDYARALTGARIGLGFLRRTWPDQHTTRTFEIPACGSMLLADRTAEHCELFKEGEEADFFEGKEELLDKLNFYCGNEPVRARIAAAGRRRCIDGKYAYIHRIEAALEALRGI